MGSDVAAKRKNHVGLAAHQRRSKSRKPLRPRLRKVIFKRDVLSFDIAKLTKTSNESLRIGILVRCAVNQDADTRPSCRLLRMGAKRSACHHKSGRPCNKVPSQHIKPPVKAQYCISLHDRRREGFPMSAKGQKRTSANNRKRQPTKWP